MAASIVEKHEVRAPPLLCLGMARTGTASLAEALRILGFGRVHHGLETPSVSLEWEILDRATDATFSVLPTYSGNPFQREQWDEWCGKWDAVTDIASFFATSLIPAYPDAKVVNVERDFEAWFKSFAGGVALWAGSNVKLRVMEGLERRTSIKPGIVSAKFHRGWLGSMELSDLLDKEVVRKAYERHYAYIRETVPAAQLLDFKLADGWGPLCAFLNKPVPDQVFPHINESEAFDNFVKAKRNEGLIRLGKTLLPGGRQRVEEENRKQAEALAKSN